eukprot:2224926-Amphidinium_carterae.1
MALKCLSVIGTTAQEVPIWVPLTALVQTSGKLKLKHRRGRLFWNSIFVQTLACALKTANYTLGHGERSGPTDFILLSSSALAQLADAADSH